MTLIEFGNSECKIDVTDKCTNLNKLPSECWDRCVLFGVDPCPGIPKKIFINGNEYPQGNEIILNSNEKYSNKYIIEFGSSECKIDITYKCTNLDKIPSECWDRCVLLGVDPCPGIPKSIFINNKAYPAGDEIDLLKLNIKDNVFYPKIYILIRCCYRPSLFKTSIESVLNQSYKNFQIILSYDDDKCLEYLNDYKNKNQNIQLIKLEKDISKNFFYNLYCNDLLKKVPEDINNWIMFLDDDDKFINNHCLENIVTNIQESNNILFWNFSYGDSTIIGAKDFNDIVAGNVASSSFLLNSIYKKFSKWTNKQEGDFEFIEKIINSKILNLNFKFLNKTFVGTINGHNSGKDEKQNIILNDYKKILIIYNDSLLSICLNLLNYFYKCDIEFIDKLKYDELLHFIDNNNNNNNSVLLILLSPVSINLNNIDIYKYNYIVYQLEQYNSNWFDENYIKTLSHSKLILDYSNYNINYLNLFNKNTIYFPLFFINSLNCYYANDNNFIYDILFIGCLNDRRNKILNKLKESYNILIIDGHNKYIKYETEDFFNILSKCRIVLNLHFYEYPILETCRLNEYLKYNKLIITEDSCQNDYEIFNYSFNCFIVDIIDDSLSNIDNIINMIEYLKNDQIYNYYIDKFKKINIKLSKKLLNFNLDYKFNIPNNYISEIKVAVITCNINNYDTYQNNINDIYNNKLFDWFYIGDTDINGLNFINVSNFKEEFIKYNILDKPDLQCKYFKTNLINFDIFKKYNYLIWMDASIILNKNFVLDTINNIKKNYDIYLFKHKKNLNISEEFTDSICLSKYYKYDMNLYKQCKDYLKNYPTSLYENGFYIIKKNNYNIKKIFQNWWEEIIKYKSTQCQISLSYVIDSKNIKIYLLNEKFSIKYDLNKNIWINNLFHVKLHHNITQNMLSLNDKFKNICKVIILNNSYIYDDSLKKYIEDNKDEIKLINYKKCYRDLHIKAYEYLNSKIDEFKNVLILQNNCDLNNINKYYHTILTHINYIKYDYDIILLYSNSFNLNNNDDYFKVDTNYINLNDNFIGYILKISNKISNINKNIEILKNNNKIDDNNINSIVYNNLNIYCYKFNYIENYNNNFRLKLKNNLNLKYNYLY